MKRWNLSWWNLVGLVALILAVGTVGVESAIDAVEDPTNIVNIAGRKGALNPGVIYTVPSGKTLVIRGASVVAVDTAGTTVFSAPLNLRCGTTYLIPKEVMVYTGGWDPLELGDLGFKCGPNKVVKLDGGPVPDSSSVGWAIVGELVNTP